MADDAVGATVRQHLSVVGACATDAHDRDETLHGRVSVRLVIAPDGRVRSATPLAPRDLRRFASCIADAASAWRVEAPGATTDFIVTWPFDLP